jgi:hypothetical protein
MSVANGQPVNAAVTNAAFVSKTTDSTVVSKVTLNKLGSGSAVDDTQNTINKLLDVIGTTEVDATPNDYANSNFITDGDNRKVAIEKLDAQLKTTQDELDAHEAASDPHPQYATDTDLADGLALKYDATNPSGYQTAAQVNSAISAVIDSAPGALDTLNELAAALGDDPNFATTVTTSLSGKEPTITATTSADYYRGDKTFQPLNKAAVGLSDVTNDAQLKRAANDFSVFTEKVTLDPDDLFLIEDSAASGVKKKVRRSAVGSGSGGGGGSINLITNGNADDAVTSIFTPYQDLSGARPTGANSSPTTGITTAITSTTPLTGLKSFTLTKDAANRRGGGWQIPFTVDPSYRAKSLKISVDYIVNSGTFVAGSTTADSDVIWYIYDVTNNVMIEPSNIKMLSNSTTLSDKYEATFQTSATGSSYQLIAHIATVSALAYSLKVDNITVSPSVYVYGSPVTDWQTYSLAITATTTNPTKGTTLIRDIARWRRVGDSMEINYSFYQVTLGTAGSGIYLFSLPPGYSIDINKLIPVGDQNQAHCGSASGFDSAAKSGFVFPYNATNLGIAIGNSGTDPIMCSSTYNSLATALTYNFSAKVPILGWSSNTQMSDGYDARAIAVSASISGTQSLTSGAATKIVFNTIANGFDKTSSLNLTTGTFTTPTAGIYQISGVINYAATALSFEADVRLYINGGFLKLNQGSKSGTGSISQSSPFIFRQELKAGDTVEIYATHNAGVSLTVRGNGSAQDLTNLNIERLSAPTTISASEKIRMSYAANSGQSIPTGSATVFIPNVKEWDTHGVFNPSTGEITFPRAGFGQIKAGCLFGSTTVSLTYIFILFKDGVQVREVGRYTKPAQNTNDSPNPICVDVDGVAGTKWTVKIFHNSVGSLSLLANTTYNYLQFSME